MRIYFDACAINRLTDSEQQTRVYEEARAVELALRLVAEGGAEMVGSTTLRLELLRNPDHEKRSDSMRILAYAAALLELTPAILLRAANLEVAGYGAFDATHLASAEEAGADILLTKDGRFCKLALRRAGNPVVEVANPLDWARKGRFDMTPVQALTDDEQFQEHALSVLGRELGLDGLAPFLRIYRSGTGDYTAERHQWLCHFTVADIAKELQASPGHEK